MSDETESTTPEEVMLAHRYRRWLLCCLFTYANPMGLPDIAHQLTVWERGGVGDDLQWNRLIVYNQLYHEHLPALTEANLVTYYQREDKAELGPAAPQVETPLQKRMETEENDLLAADGVAIHASGGTE